ncbi:AraC family transcriptional regulator [Pseudomonas nitroreducens]|uniref:AraC family transcriptional regulator n=1 Tax=Pseudomonas TaxID=286 RepID=UPI000806862D|nr:MULTISPECIES: AraC family transcriptional regulator [Pseudomonas]MCJ1882377.1 AraC family transcriptional regulator [Pseudomonas nitroreducens]MCJ1893751.1 AraC family transcriptional regulator [Pseudomonas nitroreducens]MDG9853892.1 AraC family transcriptional regulator [Pseudomonas nitroreducens]MDH1072773.1 AraC family transcriptional regulator [Pseudomonas nitroreducens]NMZ72345.1 AraC family transcriptional regulator [Pseudomonas nitroreducens]
MHADTIATWAQVIARALQAHGHDPRPLLRTAGIDPAQLQDANLRIPLERMSALWRAVERTTGDPAFGLEVAAHSLPTDFHGLLFALQSSATVGEALERVVRFSPVVSTSGQVSLERGDGVCRLIHRRIPRAQVEQMATEALLASGLRHATPIWGLGVVRCVHLARPRPIDADAWEARFGQRLVFDAAHNAVDYDPALLEIPLRSGNRELAQILDGSLNSYLKRLSGHDLPEQVRQSIVRQLPSGEVQQGLVAEELGMSTRNLHRHLLRHATSFTQLLEETRRELAFAHLRQPHCSVNEVCYRLGFNEPSSFNRAFRRWTGQSPGQWRQGELGLAESPAAVRPTGGFALAL